METKVLERAQRKPEELWAIEDLFASDQQCEQALEELRKELAKVPQYAGKLGESARTLCDYLQLQDRVDRMLSDLAEYAQRRTDEDTRVAAYQAM